MSRHIQTLDPESRKLNNQTQNGKLILTHIHGRAMSLLVQNDLLTTAQVIPFSNPDQVGEIYIGKIKNVLKNINAYFVEIGEGQICYLSFQDAQSAYVLNRKLPEAIPSHLVQGDELPVQITKNPLKTKLASVSAALELQSEYFVIKAGMAGLGVSNKIDKVRTKQIRSILEPLLPTDAAIPFTVIARTSCQELKEDRLVEEFHQQCKNFLALFQNAHFKTCFSCLQANSSPVCTAVYNVPAHEYQEIVTDDPAWYELLQSDANLKNCIRLYSNENITLANLYGLHAKLENACSRKVWMKSGANLIIEQTECLNTIDVNTGKNLKGNSPNDTILQINKEAAREAAIQIRLRNLSGIIIIDFINMNDKKLEEELLKYLSELTATDPVPTRVIDITPLGLVEITRKKINSSLSEQLKES